MLHAFKTSVAMAMRYFLFLQLLVIIILSFPIHLENLPS